MPPDIFPRVSSPNGEITISSGISAAPFDHHQQRKATAATTTTRTRTTRSGFATNPSEFMNATTNNNKKGNSSQQHQANETCSRDVTKIVSSNNKYSRTDGGGTASLDTNQNNDTDNSMVATAGLSTMPDQQSNYYGYNNTNSNIALGGGVGGLYGAGGGGMYYGGGGGGYGGVGGMYGGGGAGGYYGYGSPYFLGGGFPGAGPLSNLNQFLFSVQSVIFSLGQAVQIIGMNAQGLKQLVESISGMVDHAIQSWNELQKLESASRQNESEDDKKRRRRLRAFRMALVAGVSYLGYKIVRRFFFRKRTAQPMLGYPQYHPQQQCYQPPPYVSGYGNPVYPGTGNYGPGF